MPKKCTKCPVHDRQEMEDYMNEKKNQKELLKTLIKICMKILKTLIKKLKVEELLIILQVEEVI